MGGPNRVKLKGLGEKDKGKNRQKPGLTLLNPSEMNEERIRSKIKKKKPAWRVELDSRQKGRRDRMMRSNNFQTRK